MREMLRGISTGCLNVAIACLASQVLWNELSYWISQAILSHPKSSTLFKARTSIKELQRVDFILLTGIGVTVCISFSIVHKLTPTARCWEDRSALAPELLATDRESTETLREPLHFMDPWSDNSLGKLQLRDQGTLWIGRSDNMPDRPIRFKLRASWFPRRPME